MRRLGELTEEHQELLERIEYVQEHGQDNTDWEDDFLESVANWVGKDHDLSDPQMETLEKIEFKCENGLEEYWEVYGRG